MRPSFDGANYENSIDNVLLSLSYNDPGIGATCMPDFVDDTNDDGFGAQCVNPDIDRYQQNFTQDYSEPGKMKYVCECGVTDGYIKYVDWKCSPRDENDIEIPPRNLMQTQDILFNLTVLGENNNSSTNAWILGVFM